MWQIVGGGGGEKGVVILDYEGKGGGGWSQCIDSDH